MYIGFYQSGFLIALVVIGILLLIHLWKRPRTIVLKFSTLQFFDDNTIKKTKLRKFRQMFLLLARIAVTTLIILLFAGIHFSDTTISRLRDSSTSLFVWVDPSPSMQYSDGSPSIGQQAFDLIDSIESEIPLSRFVFVYDHGINAFVEYQSEAITYKCYHGPLVLDRVVQSMVTHPQYTAKSVLLCISDCQIFTSDILDSLRNRHTYAQRMVCITKIPDVPWNFSLENVTINRNGALECAVKAEGDALLTGRLSAVTGTVRSVPVKISVEKNRTQIFTIPVESKDGSYLITLDANDPLSFDNSRVVNVNQTNDRNIIILGDSVKNFVIASALHALGSEKWGSVMLRACEAITPDELREASFIIVNSSGVSCPVIERLVSMADNKGRTILYCMGTGEAMEDKNLLERLLPEVTYPELVAVEKGAFLVLPDIQSGIWSGFPVKFESQMKITRYRSPVAGIPLCFLSDGGVLFSLYNNKGGLQWLFSAIPLGINTTNNVWETGAYVPVIDRLVEIAHKKQLSEAMVLAGFPVHNPIFYNQQNGFIYDPDEKIYPVADNPRIVFDNPGFYKVFVRGELKKTIAVIADTNESRMSYRAPREVHNAGSSLEVFTQSEFLQLIRQGDSHARYYIRWMLILLFIGVEIFLWGTGNDQYKDQQPKQEN